MTTLPLHRGILYGPVASRRLGRSLGINLSPRQRKACSFNCVYCHYGRTKRLTLDSSPFISDLPTMADVLEAVHGALTGTVQFDVLTFSGNGEPTLHPEFPHIVDRILELRDRHRPGLHVALLTNSSRVWLTEIRDAALRVDVPIFKLDAGTEDGFRAINRPAPGVTLETVVNGLAGMRGVVLQTLLVDGEPTNLGEREIDAYLECVRRIRPMEVQVHSIDRPVPQRRLVKVMPDVLGRFADEATHATGVVFRAYGHQGAVMSTRRQWTSV